jgi:hypothetical protein
MDKLSIEYQERFKENLIFDTTVFDRIDKSVKLHEETKNHPLSSSAACINVLGSMSLDPKGLQCLLNSLNLEVEEVLKFPSPVTYCGRVYNDEGYVVFEWVGPQKSPINERGGSRGQNRTSIDAFLITRIAGRITQVLIEWKFTEGMSRDIALGRFSGQKGVERYRRYSPVLAKLRKNKTCPFRFSEEYDAADEDSSLGLHDFSADHFYQLLRITLLAKTTTPSRIGDLMIEDYRIVHLSHSKNNMINIVHPNHLLLSPGLKRFSGESFHTVWRGILEKEDKMRFVSGYWDTAIHSIPNKELREYLDLRYAVL